MVLAALPAAAGHTEHSRIYIYGDEGFLLPHNGVTRGTGTPLDPYVIEGWSFSLDDPIYRRFSELTDGSFLGYAAITVIGTSKHFVIRDVTIQGGELDNLHGISLVGVQQARIEDVWINGTAAAIDSYQSQYVQVERAHVRGHGRILGQDPGMTVITTGLYFTDTNRVTVRDSDVAQHYNGIRLAGIHTAVTANTTLLDNLGSGVSVSAGRDDPPGLTFLENVTTRGSRLGLVLHEGNVTIRSSSLTDHVTAIQPQDRAGVSRLRVESSHFARNERAGVEGSGHVELVGNRFTENRGWAVHLKDSHGGLIINNNITQNLGRVADHAIVLSNQTGVQVLGNLIEYNRNLGIELGYDSHDTTIEGNVIRHNAFGAPNGMGNIDVLSNNNTIQYNVVTENGGSGITLWDVHGNVVQHNDLTGNTGADVTWQNHAAKDQNTVGPNDSVSASTVRAGAPFALLAVAIGLLLRRRPTP